MYSHSLAVVLKMLALRAGPEDLPFSQELTRVMLVLSLFLVTLLLTLGAPVYAAVPIAVTGIGANAGFTWVLLQRRGLGNRYQQTLNAQLAIGCLFALAMLPAFAIVAPEVAQAKADPDLLKRMHEGDFSMIEIPEWIGLYTDAVFIWSLVVHTRIIRQATGADVLRSSLMAVGMMFFMLFAISFAQALLAPGV